MDENTKAMAWTLIKIGLVGTAVGVPIGIWAMKRWNQPGETWKTALLLTAVGFGVKELMLKRPEAQSEEAFARSEEAAAREEELASWRAPRRGMGAYMPAPGMPPAPSVYYPNLKQKANGRPAMQSGLNPTAL